MKSLALARGGLCLSKEYVNDKTRLFWECAKGHRWKTRGSIVRRGSWCHLCAVRVKRPLTIESIHELAEQRGFQCLSGVYNNSRTAMVWRCAEGHQFRRPPKMIRTGAGCPECNGWKRKTIADMRKLAEQRGGRCLSKKYKNPTTPLRWVCAKGHVWKARYASLKNGCWCPFCAGRGKTIRDMIMLARARGGFCLSSRFVGVESKLAWKCKKGHIWEARPMHVRAGTWCPVCARTNMTMNLAGKFRAER
jgi:hypothetical protein